MAKTLLAGAAKRQPELEQSYFSRRKEPTCSPCVLSVAKSENRAVSTLSGPYDVTIRVAYDSCLCQ